MKSQYKRIAIVGGGAAGVFCAIRLAQNPNLDIHIFEKSNELLKKVKISGGGRCNVTHHYSSTSQFVKNYPRGTHILKKNFSQFSPQNMVEWLTSRGVKLKTEADGRVFPMSDDSQTIINVFLRELNQKNITIHFNACVDNIDYHNGQYRLTIQEQTHIYPTLVIASGGVQKIRDMDYLHSLNIDTVSPVPSLFTFKIQDKSLTTLMGLSVPSVTIRIIGSKYMETGPLLITHWGISGPAVLKLSAWGAFYLSELDYHFQISINWLGGQSDEDIKTYLLDIQSSHTTALISNKKPSEIPSRLWHYFLEKSEISVEKKWSELSKKELHKLIHTLAQSTYSILGKTTFKEEFVTAGGISTEALQTSTMESKQYPNLYVIGELTNIDGITGGFNFQNAWTSAAVCAADIAKKK